MPEIAGYGFGRVTIDGREETRDVIVLPERVVRGWWREEGHGLVLEDLEEVIDELPERLLVGTGTRLPRVSSRRRPVPARSRSGRPAVAERSCRGSGRHAQRGKTTFLIQGDEPVGSSGSQVTTARGRPKRSVPRAGAPPGA